MSLRLFQTPLYSTSLKNLPDKKLLITTINAHSYNVAQRDELFSEALINSDVLLPDGISVVWAKKFLNGKKIQKIAGADLLLYKLNKLQTSQGSCFFLGSSESTLGKIKERVAKEYPHVKVYTYSPPYKPEFTEEENTAMINAINAVQPEVLFIGMTAPKQEKWAYRHLSQLQAGHVCCIGAVFDFYAGTVQRAPAWLIKAGLEWLYRLLKEPGRMWYRYLVGNFMFVLRVLIEKIRK